MSKKKAGGKASQHVSPEGKRLGVKVVSGQKVTTGSVLVRQNGAVFGAGKNVKKSRDFTLIALKNGVVKYGQKLGKKIISIVSD